MLEIIFELAEHVWEGLVRLLEFLFRAICNVFTFAFELIVDLYTSRNKKKERNVQVTEATTKNNRSDEYDHDED